MSFMLRIHCVLSCFALLCEPNAIHSDESVYLMQLERSWKDAVSLARTACAPKLR